MTSGQTVAPHPSSPPAQSLKEGETTFWFWLSDVTCHSPVMVSPGPNRSPGAGLLHTIEAGADDIDDDDDASSEEEEGDRRVGGAASARCRGRMMTEMTRRKRQDQGQGECISPMQQEQQRKRKKKGKRKKDRLCLMSERTGRRRWKEKQSGEGEGAARGDDVLRRTDCIPTSLGR